MPVSGGYLGVEASEDGGHEMWGEGANDLWGRLEREEDEHEAELLEAIRSRLRKSTNRGDDNPKQPPAGLKAAALAIDATGGNAIDLRGAGARASG